MKIPTYERALVRLSLRGLRLVSVSAAFAYGVLLSLPTPLAQTVPSSNANVTPEIIVTASRSEQALQTAPVGATIITREQIASAGVSDANEAVRKIAGVPAKSDLNGGREYKLDLRGFGETSDQNTVVLIDGIRMSENELAGARLSSIPAHMIERIEVLRGGSSVMWGEGATAGVIHIITRQSPATSVSGQVGLGVQSDGARDGMAALRASTALGGLDVLASSSSTPGYRKSNNQAHQDVWALGLQGKQGGWQWRLRIQNETMGSGLPGSLSFDQFAQDPRQVNAGKLKDHGGLKETRLLSGLGYTWGAWTVALDVARKSKDVQSADGSGYQAQTQSTTHQYSPRLSYVGNLSSTQLTANMGLDVNQWEYATLSTYGGAQSTQHNRAAFVMTDWLLPSQTRIMAGLRSEKIEKSTLNSGATDLLNLNNRLHASEFSINQTVQSGLDVYLRWAQSYRMANVDEYRNNSPFVVIRPQRSVDKELGVKYRQAGQSMAVRYFVQNTVDEIAYDQVNYVNTNIDPTLRKGIELQASSILSHNLTLSGSLQSMKAVFNGGVNAGKHVPLVSEQSATVRLSYKIDAQHSVETAWRMLGSSYFYGDEANDCGKKIPANRLFDALYRWRESSQEWALGITNLTNQTTYNYAYSCTSGSLYPEPGRVLRVSLKLNF